MLTQLGWVQAQARTLAVERDRQQGAGGLAPIGQGHWGQATGSKQVGVSKQILGVGDGGKRQAVIFKHGCQGFSAVPGQTLAQQRHHPIPGQHPIVVRL